MMPIGFVRLLTARGTLSILIFHRVLQHADPLLSDLPDAATFERLVALLVARCTVLPLHDALSRLKAGALPNGAVAFTFDDGYADNHEIAMPILKRHGVTATFFVATGFIDGGIMWNDRIIESVRHTKLEIMDLGEIGIGVVPVNTVEARRTALSTLLTRLKYLHSENRRRAVDRIVEIAQTKETLPTGLMLTSTMVKGLAAAGMEVGAHTVSHPILARMEDADARSEIAESREQLVELLRQPVRIFAYPNGRPRTDYASAHVSMVREAGFEAAVTTSSGAARPGDDMYQLPRFTPWDQPGELFLLRLLRNRLRHPSLA
jgi:peptidoglycan/xylan/chitin deacetylase (PgdA/CDA1 family)